MGGIAGYNTQIYIASGPLSLTNEAMTDSGDHTTFNDSTVAHQCWNNAVSPVVQAKWDELWTITLTGGPTGGSFKLIFGSQTTGAIAYNASASAVQTAFTALSSVNSGNAQVSGPNGGPWTIEFISALGYAAQTAITVDDSLLTGGSSPHAVPARVQAGQGFTTQSGNYLINYPIGQIIFNAALLGTPVARVASGSYLPSSFLSYAKLAQPTVKAAALDVTSFQNPPSQWKQFIGGLAEGDIKIDLFWIDATFLNHISNGDLLIVKIYPGQNSNQRYQGYGILNTDAISGDVAKTVDESLSFTLNGQLFFTAS